MKPITAVPTLILLLAGCGGATLPPEPIGDQANDQTSVTPDTNIGHGQQDDQGSEPAADPPDADQADPDPEPSPATAAFSIAAAFDQLLARGARFTMSGQFIENGVALSQEHHLTQTALAASPTWLGGTTPSGYSMVEVLRVVDGSEQAIEHHVKYYDANNNLIGEQQPGQDSYWIALDGALERPRLAHIGQSGSIGRTESPDRIAPTADPFRETSWQLNPGSNGQAVYCELTNDYTAAGTLNWAFEWCWHIRADDQLDAGEAAFDGRISFRYETGSSHGLIEGDNLTLGPAVEPPVVPAIPDGAILTPSPDIATTEQTLDCKINSGSTRYTARLSMQFEPASLAFSVDSNVKLQGNFRWNPNLNSYVHINHVPVDPDVKVVQEARLDANMVPVYFAEQRIHDGANPYSLQLSECYNGILYRPPVVTTGPENRLNCTHYSRWPPDYVPTTTIKSLRIIDGHLFVDGQQGIDLVEGYQQDPVSGGSENITILANGWYRFASNFSAKGGSAYTATLEFHADGTIRRWQTTSGFTAEQSTNCVPG